MFSSESSARQRIHMKYQALFSSKDKSKKLKCRLLQFLFGALRVKRKVFVPVGVNYFLYEQDLVFEWTEVVSLCRKEQTTK